MVTGQLANQTVNAVVEQAIVSRLPDLPPIQLFLLILGVSLVLAKIVEVLGSRGIKQLLKHRESEMDTIVFKEIHTPIYLTVALSGFYVALVSLDIGNRLDFYARAFALTAIALIWSWAAIRGGNRFFQHVKEHKSGYEFAPIFENIWTFLVLIVALFSLLAIWNVDITPLLASAGVAGVVIGFAAKDAVANLFGGVALYFDNTYKIGDYIVIESGEAGTVVDIGIRSTTIITRDEVTVTIPNSVLNSSRVINESAPKERKRIRIPVGVAYGTDVDRLEEVLVAVAEEEDMVLGHPHPRVRFREFGDSALQYELLCWVEAPLQDVKATHELNRTIYKRLDEEGIEIPFPKRDVYMRDQHDGARTSDDLS